MQIHLVTYATPRFRLRQLILGWSAKVNHVVDTVTHWSPEKLLKAGFEERCKDIKLTERGSGFWAWKAFIIDAKLREVPDGDLVFYCDVGRLYPFKMLDQPITPFVNWMDSHGQDFMPGVNIPWDGSVAVWTKREALVATGMDQPDVHAAVPVQASFSIWRAGAKSRHFIGQWLNLCTQRRLISDDPSCEGLVELKGFRAHRHDQALLTLCCVAEDLKGLSLRNQNPEIDVRNPSQVSQLHFGGAPGYPTISGQILRITSWPVQQLELRLRKKVKFGTPLNE